MELPLVAGAPLWGAGGTAQRRCCSLLGHRSGAPAAPLGDAARIPLWGAGGTAQGRCYTSLGHRSGALLHAARSPLWGAGGTAQGRRCTLLGDNCGAPGALLRGAAARL